MVILGLFILSLDLLEALFVKGVGKNLAHRVGLINLASHRWLHFDQNEVMLSAFILLIMVNILPLTTDQLKLLELLGGHVTSTNPSI